jgi:hypothetical protein
MTKSTLALLALAAALAGCPLPQAVPSYSTGTVTPPRILMDPLVADPLLGNGNPIIFVPASCLTTAPTYPLSLQVSDSNTIESIEARVFVNYDPRFTPNAAFLEDYIIPPNANSNDLVRDVPPLPQFFNFRPYDFGPSPGAPAVPHQAPYDDEGILRVVEFVVSNGFDPQNTSSTLPNRAPLKGFETQVFRWVFLSVPKSSVPLQSLAGCE